MFTAVNSIFRLAIWKYKPFYAAELLFRRNINLQKTLFDGIFQYILSESAFLHKITVSGGLEAVFKPGSSHAVEAKKEKVMKDFNVEELDQYMQRRKIDPVNLCWYDPAEGDFEINGLYWFAQDKRYHRFPQGVDYSFKPALESLAACNAGAQIRFRSNSRRIVVSAKVASGAVSPTMAECGRSGFDLYVGEPGSELFWNCALPFPGQKEYADEIFNVKEQKMREFRLNFPLYNSVQALSIALDEGSEILPPTPLKIKKPIVIYGTSITQGGCASRPGTAFTNRLSRTFQAEFLNFGFSGNGQNDLPVAELLAAIKDPAMFIIDSEANSVSGKLVNERVPEFLNILRKKHPSVPILIVTKITYGPRYALEIPVLKEYFYNIYQARRAAGDEHIYFVDGSDFYSPEDYSENSVDGAHPTDQGFAVIAKKLEPVLRDLIKKYNL